MVKKNDTKSINTVAKSDNKEGNSAARGIQSFEVQNLHLDQQDIEGLI